MTLKIMGMSMAIICMLIKDSKKIIKIFIYMEILNFILLVYFITSSIKYMSTFSILLIQVLESIILILALLTSSFFWKSMNDWLL